MPRFCLYTQLFPASYKWAGKNQYLGVDGNRDKKYSTPTCLIFTFISLPQIRHFTDLFLVLYVVILILNCIKILFLFLNQFLTISTDSPLRKMKKLINPLTFF